MNNKTKKIGLIATLLLMVGSLSACKETSDVNSVGSISSATNDDNDQQIDTTDNGLNEETGNLSISGRCNGCGHCSLIDSEHFSRSFGRSAPTVISQDNLDSSNLLAAINRCPTRAIQLTS
ncbi:hypothetical protein C0583_00520 [Candidatus Parcubacteria bacterium]|nr:MAG: hypothetical protein C0583_00520 [Candidatus Parcubacteria bacterium]